jgi:transposase-like protein
MGRKTRRSFTKEYKAEVVGLISKSGKTVGAVCRDLGLTETAVRRWVQQAEVDSGRGRRGQESSSVSFRFTTFLQERCSDSEGKGIGPVAAGPERAVGPGQIDQIDGDVEIAARSTAARRSGCSEPIRYFFPLAVVNLTPLSPCKKNADISRLRRIP